MLVNVVPMRCRVHTPPSGCKRPRMRGRQQVYSSRVRPLTLMALGIRETRTGSALQVYVVGDGDVDPEATHFYHFRFKIFGAS